eukprot:TRINITY_DN10970_c0_g1_i1.p1 TRINITY_DN10970_c0_g1~~TRINITY_DN10970_c0_g1_i1.p1  ORF type:complete len:843 (-),score=82.33 TRINITY_DN10970_c0_g1_i1:311-2788(-)
MNLPRLVRTETPNSLRPDFSYQAAKVLRKHRLRLVKFTLVTCLWACLLLEPPTSSDVMAVSTTTPSSRPQATSGGFFFFACCSFCIGGAIFCIGVRHYEDPVCCRGNDCSCQCSKCIMGLLFMTTGLFISLMPWLFMLLYIVLKLLIEFLLSSDVSIFRIAESTGFIWALYSLVLLYLLACAMHLAVHRLGQKMAVGLPDLVEAKLRAVSRIWDHWITLYLVSWAAIGASSLVVSCEPAEHAEIMRLIGSLAVPQVFFIAIYELAPYEFAAAVGQAQLIVLASSLVGFLWTCSLLLQGRFGDLQSSEVSLVAGGIMSGITLILSLVGYVVTTQCLQSKLSQSELQRQRSLLYHGRSFLCTMCNRSDANALNRPCGHLFLCLECARAFQEREGTVCNACRQPSRLVSVEVRETFAPFHAVAEHADCKDNVLQLLAGLWKSHAARMRMRRWRQKKMCTQCRGKADAVNVPCGHSGRCFKCAQDWRGIHGARCDECKTESSIEVIVTTQKCNICYDDIATQNLVAVGACGHQLCVDCAVGYVRSALGNVADSVKPQGLRCPMSSGSPSCTTFLSTIVVRQQLIDRGSTNEAAAESLTFEDVDRLERFVEESSIPVHRRFYCVNEKCARLLSIDLHSLLASTSPRFECEHCGMHQCARCKVLWHGALSCDEVSSMQGSADAGGQTSTADSRLIEVTSKPCPQCGVRISHYHGHACHHIRPGTGCLNCGHHFCYGCLQPGRGCRACSVYCREDRLDSYIVASPYPHDTRCGCPICPDCQQGLPCPQCDGTCVVCTGKVPPGKMTALAPETAKGVNEAASRIFSRWFPTGL